MFRSRRITASLAAVGAAAALAACGGASGSGSGSGGSGGSGASASLAGSGNAGNLPTVTMMVGGIDKQIYLPYQLAQDLGYFKKFGVNMQLSTEQDGGVGAEEAMASGQVDMAGAWYVHTIDFQQKGKNVVDVVQLSGAPGEREMCAKGAGVSAASQWKGKSVGVTDIGSGTDNLTEYLAHRAGLTTQQYSRVGVGAGPTFVAALEHQRIACGMTSQPTAGAVQSKGIGTTMINLASVADTKQALGGVYPAAAVLARADWVASHRKVVQDVVDAMVATMHWIATHSAAQIAAKMPPQFVSNGLTTKAAYISELSADKGQFLPNGLMPAGAPQTALAIDRFVGNVTRPVNMPATYTNQYALTANRQLGYVK
jgi:NitT/TauT family transport system substrate-binding protein